MAESEKLVKRTLAKQLPSSAETGGKSLEFISELSFCCSDNPLLSAAVSRYELWGRCAGAVGRIAGMY